MKLHYLFSSETNPRELEPYLQGLRDERIIKGYKINRFKPREKFPVGDLIGVFRVGLELLNEAKRTEIDSYLAHRYGAVPESVTA